MLFLLFFSFTFRTRKFLGRPDDRMSTHTHTLTRHILVVSHHRPHPLPTVSPTHYHPHAPLECLAYTAWILLGCQTEDLFLFSLGCLWSLVYAIRTKRKKRNGFWMPKDALTSCQDRQKEPRAKENIKGNYGNKVIKTRIASAKAVAVTWRWFCRLKGLHRLFSRWSNKNCIDRAIFLSAKIGALHQRLWIPL